MFLYILCLTLFVLCMQEVMLLSLHSITAKTFLSITLKVNTTDIQVMNKTPLFIEIYTLTQ